MAAPSSGHQQDLNQGGDDVLGDSGQSRLTERQRMRAVANNIILHLHPTRVPAGALRLSYTWGLGGIAALLVTLLVSTGVLLMFRYEANVDRAYLSIQVLETEVMFGSLLRAVHHWSANLLLVVTFLHLLRVFFTGGFMRGRALNWLVGVALLVLVLAFNFTGYLLPWDQLAYWAVTVGTSLLSYIPLLGRALASFLLAGPEVGQAALSNFYAIHVAVLPALLVLTLTYHFWRIRKDGGISQPLPRPGEARQSLTTIPHLVRPEYAAATVLLATVILWSMFVKAPLADVADPGRSPNPAKAAWYFLGLQELLLHMHALALMGLLAIGLAALLLIPWWDRRHERVGLYFRSVTGRRAALLGTLLSLEVVPLLIVADEYWIDLPALLPGWPDYLSNGLIPLLLTLTGLAAIYGGLRWVLGADHSEGLSGLFAFVMASIILLTISGIFFRGPNMVLVLPF